MSHKTEQPIIPPETRERMIGSKEMLKSDISQAGSEAAEKAGRVKERTGEYLERGTQDVKEIGGAVKEKLSGYVDIAKEKLGDIGHRMGEFK